MTSIKVMLFFLFILSIHGTCHDQLKAIFDTTSPYQFKEIRESKVGDDLLISVFGSLNVGGPVKSLASLEYRISHSAAYGDEIDIGLMFTNTSVRGLGIQRVLFENLLEKHSSIKRINTSLTSDNEDIVKRSLMRLFMVNDYDVKSFTPGGSNEEIFEQCCGDIYSSLTKEQREAFLIKAIADTPAYKIRNRLGLKPCEIDPLDSSFSRRAGEFSLTIYVSFCRP